MSKFLNKITDKTSLQLKKKKIVAIDMDGTICEELDYFDFYKAKKICDTETILKKLKIKRSEVYVVIYTARLTSDRLVTERWLDANDIDYDLLCTNKLPYDILVDDRALNMKEKI